MKQQIASRLASSNYNQPDRLFSLDLLKAISIAAVVSYHSVFVPRSTYTTSLLPLDTAFASLRFCVPVLFTISFFLFDRGLTNRCNEPILSSIRKRLVRLAIPIAFWFSLAATLKLITGNDLAKIILALFDGTIFQGAYYLIVILQFIPIFIWLREWFHSSKNILITAVLQGFVFLLINAILNNPRDTQTLAILRTTGRSLFIYWFIYMALGAYFYKNWSSIVEISSRISIPLKVVLFTTSCLFLAAEYNQLFLSANGLVPPFDYAMLSCIVSVIVAFLCFAAVEEDQLAIPIKKLVLLLSKYSLGIFCINGIMSEVFLSFGSRLFHETTFNFPEILAIKFGGWALLLGLSLAASMLLDRIGLRACVR